MTTIYAILSVMLLLPLLLSQATARGTELPARREVRPNSPRNCVRSASEDEEF